MVSPAHAAWHKRKLSPQAGMWTFQVPSSAAIAVGTNRRASLADLKVGDQVIVGFAQENGALVAKRILDRVPRPAGKPKDGSKPDGRHHKAAQGLAHVRGVVEAVDAQAGKIVVAGRAGRAR